MTLLAYQQARAKHEQYKVDLNKVIKLHKEDPDLFHPLGKDKNCAYCDQYNEIRLQHEKLLQQLETYERENTVEEPIIQRVIKSENVERPRRRYSIYSLTFRDGSEVLVYACSQQTACNIAGKAEEKLSKAIIIKKEYYNSFYLERENGAITTLTSALSGRQRNKSYIIAEKQQTKVKASGVCFNEAPIQFFKYTPDKLKELSVFCDHLPIIKTKKFNSKGRISLQTSRGSFALDPGQVLIKIGKDIFFAMDKEEFEHNFVEEESLVWAEK